MFLFPSGRPIYTGSFACVGSSLRPKFLIHKLSDLTTRHYIGHHLTPTHDATVECLLLNWSYIDIIFHIHQWQVLIRISFCTLISAVFMGRTVILRLKINGVFEQSQPTLCKFFIFLFLNNLLTKICSVGRYFGKFLFGWHNSHFVWGAFPQDCDVIEIVTHAWLVSCLIWWQLETATTSWNIENADVLVKSYFLDIYCLQIRHLWVYLK